MKSGKIAENIFNAIDVIVDKKLREASYDRTIVGKVIKIESEEYGRYEIQYQSASFTALSIGSEKYNENDFVYILVPTNDLSRDKYILGLSNSRRRASSISELVTLDQLQDLILRIQQLESKDYVTDEELASKGYATSEELEAQKVTVSPIEVSDGTTIATIQIGDEIVDLKAPTASAPNVQYEASEEATGATLGTLTINGETSEIKGQNLSSYATQAWVENKGYLTTDIEYGLEASTNESGEAILVFTAEGTPEKTYSLVGENGIKVEYNNNNFRFRNESQVSYEQSLAKGTQIGTIKIGDASAALYAPTPSEYRLAVDGTAIVLLENDTSGNSITVPYATSAGSAENAAQLGGKEAAAYVRAIKIGDNEAVKTPTNGTVTVSIADRASYGVVKSDYEGSDPQVDLAGYDKAYISEGYIYYRDTNTTYEEATTAAVGLMSAADKRKLNSIAENATANEGTITGVNLVGSSIATSGVANIPAASRTNYGVVKSDYEGQGSSGDFIGYNKAWVYDGYVYYKDTIYGVATESAAGLISSAMVKKLNGIENNATANKGTITEVQMANTSLGSSGSVNIPAANYTDYGVVKSEFSGGQDLDASGYAKAPIAGGYVYYHDTTYTPATQAAAGLMSSDHYNALEKIKGLNMIYDDSTGTLSIEF